jgi:hypothetical protein
VAIAMAVLDEEMEEGKDDYVVTCEGTGLSITE